MTFYDIFPNYEKTHEQQVLSLLRKSVMVTIYLLKPTTQLDTDLFIQQNYV